MTDPYYADEHVTLYHGDCLEITDWLTADVLVTDPPYGMSYRSGFRPTVDPIAGDHSPALRDAALALWTGPALVFGTWRVPAPVGERQRLVWWKQGLGPGMGNLDMPWGSTHEDVYVLGPGWSTSSRIRRAPSVLVTTAGMGGPNGVVAQAGHPTAKPVGLLEQLIDRCPPGTIADPFAGGGSTLIAARNLGRPAIGVELDEQHCETIAKRLSQGVLFR